MIVATSDGTNEAALSGDSAEYRALAGLIRRGDGALDLRSDADVTPYHAALAQVVVRHTGAPAVTISVADGRALLIEGPAGLLATLADIVDDAAQCHDPQGHVHVEYFPEHEFLGEHSVSLTIADATETSPRTS